MALLWASGRLLGTAWRLKLPPSEATLFRLCICTCRLNIRVQYLFMAAPKYPLVTPCKFGLLRHWMFTRVSRRFGEATPQPASPLRDTSNLSSSAPPLPLGIAKEPHPMSLQPALPPRFHRQL